MQLLSGNSEKKGKEELRTLLVRWLRLFEPQSESLDESDLLANHHIIHDRLTVNGVVYGPIIYEKNGRTFDWIYQLYRQGETATMGWSNIQDIDKIYLQGNAPPWILSAAKTKHHSAASYTKRKTVVFCSPVAFHPVLCKNCINCWHPLQLIATIGETVILPVCVLLQSCMRYTPCDSTGEMCLPCNNIKESYSHLANSKKMTH